MAASKREAVLPLIERVCQRYNCPIKKGYDNVLKCEIPLNEENLIAGLMSGAHLNAAEASALKGCSTIRELGQKFAALENKTDKHSKIEQELNSIYPSSSAAAAVGEKLQDLLPTFVYF